VTSHYAFNQSETEIVIQRIIAFKNVVVSQASDPGVGGHGPEHTAPEQDFSDVCPFRLHGGLRKIDRWSLARKTKRQSSNGAPA